MSEVVRVILGLRSAGWNDTAINDFILWIESGNDTYKPSNDQA